MFNLCRNNTNNWVILILHSEEHQIKWFSVKKKEMSLKNVYFSLISGCGDFQPRFVSNKRLLCIGLTVKKNPPILRKFYRIISKLRFATLQHNFREGSLHISSLLICFGKLLFHSLTKLRHAYEMQVCFVRKTFPWSHYLHWIRRSTLENFPLVAYMLSDFLFNVPLTQYTFSNSVLMKGYKMPQDSDKWQALVKTITNPLVPENADNSLLP